jgi:alpha-amylase/alpha-mannosidase (GH57 family)
MISGDHDLSYDEVARIGAKKLGLNTDLIRPLRAAEAGYNEHIPPHTTLDTECLREFFGMEVPQVVWTIEQAFSEPQKLVGSW